MNKEHKYPIVTGKTVIIDSVLNTNVDDEIKKIYEGSAKQELLTSRVNLQIGSLQENTTIDGKSALEILKYILV